MSLASVYGGILQAQQRIVTDLALPGLTAAQVHRRKKALRLKTDAVLPLCLICPSAEVLLGSDMPDADGPEDYLRYPTFVVFIQESLYRYEDLDWQMYVRERTRKALRVTTFAEAAAVFDCGTYDPDPVFDLSGLEAGYDVSVQGFTYNAREARTG